MSSISTIPNMKAKTLTVMATRVQDQTLVAQAAQQLSIDHVGDNVTNYEKKSQTSIIPAFGWHPWFSHHLYDDSTFTNDSNTDDKAATLLPSEKARHYRQVLTPSPPHNLQADEYISLLPDPRPLSIYISELRAHLVKFPTAIVGEVGMDKTFRLPEHRAESEISTIDTKSQEDDQLTKGGREGRSLTPYKVTIAHQRVVLLAQLRVAGELKRAVSVHGVGAHGLLFDTLKLTWEGQEAEVLSSKERKRRIVEQKRIEILKAKGHAVEDVHDKEDEADVTYGSSLEDTMDSDVEHQILGKAVKFPFPPRICLHSFSGPAETAKQYLNPSIPAEIFFSFSETINFAKEDPVIENEDKESPASQGETHAKSEPIVKIIPADKLLIESDLNTAGPRMDRCLELITRRICLIRKWDLEDGVKILGHNWKRFAFGQLTA